MTDAIGPFWRYYGGKWRAAPRYPSPSYDTIIEPFAGAAGYACRWHWLDVVLVEKSPRVAAIWRWLIEATPADVLALPDVPDVPDGGTTDDIDAPQGARDLVGFWCNGGAAAPCKTPSAWVRKYRDDPSTWVGWTRARPRVASWVQKIKHWQIIEGDYTDGPDGPATRFVDPPYQTPAGTHYPHKFTEHHALGLWCQSRPGQIIACDQAGADWLPWTGGLSLKSTLGESREVLYHRNDAQGSLFG